MDKKIAQNGKTIQELDEVKVKGKAFDMEAFRDSLAAYEAGEERLKAYKSNLLAIDRKRTAGTLEWMEENSDEYSPEQLQEIRDLNEEINTPGYAEKINFQGKALSTDVSG